MAAVLTLAPARIASARSPMEDLREAATVVSELRQAENGIPEHIWNRAQCVVVVPDLKKAGFILGGEFGSGVMSCRTGNAWGAPVFMSLAKGSAGFQIGAEEIDLVLLIMNRTGAEKLLGNGVTLGADVSVAAGPVGRTASAATDAQLSAEMLSYSRSRGLFAGVDFSGGALKPDKDDNAEVYGSNRMARDIAFGAVPPRLNPETRAFMDALAGRGVRGTSGAYR
jgi:lipid-binding SYLF domain-containing protein